MDGFGINYILLIDGICFQAMGLGYCLQNIFLIKDFQTKNF